MSLKSLLILVPCALFSLCLFAQKKKKEDVQKRVVCKYGDVKPEDFAPTVYPIDSAAEAVFLFEGGSVEFEGNYKGYFDVVFRVHKRMRLLKKNAFDDLGTVKLYQYMPADSKNQQRISNLQATTYNIEGDKVVATKLDKGAFFKDKDGEYLINKFTFSNLKEGSIVEYSYIINTPGYSLPTWTFQGQYPRLWSEYEISVPEYYDYVLMAQGYHPYTIDSLYTTQKSYKLTYVDSDPAARSENQIQTITTMNHLWAMKDLPAIKRESFITSLKDYNSQLEFQLAVVKYPHQPEKPILHNWTDVSKDLMEDDDFGAAVTHANNFFNDDVKMAIGDAKDPVEKAKRIYEYVRDHFTCTDDNALITSQPLKKTYQDKKGNVADINLLLVAMLLSQDIESHPALLSTTDHGKASAIYPILSKFNYVICNAKIDGKTYLLDAANSKLGFNHLSTNCYNGFTRVVDPVAPDLIPLVADSLKEVSTTTVFIVNGENNKLSASISSTKGYAESLGLREELSKKSNADFFKTIKNTYTGEVSLENEDIDSLKLYDDPVKVKYDLTMNLGDDDIIYFNPILYQQKKENPFTVAERYYPVEMPYCVDETYIFNMEIPKGYEIDELPKSTRVKLNEDEGMFEYIIAKNGNYIQMRARVKLEKAVYEPDDYQTLRDFFGFIVKKEAEEIVFKKVK